LAVVSRLPFAVCRLPFAVGRLPLAVGRRWPFAVGRSPIGWRRASRAAFFKEGGVMQDFRKLQVWRDAQELTVDIYKITASFPYDERFGLTSQLRRASVSIGANIAEGCKRATPVDKAHFMNIAEGSSAESISEFDVARRLCYVSEKQALEIIDRFDHICAMLERLRQQIVR
jgi:four helix bundle protein